MTNIEPYKDQDLPDRFQRWLETLRQKIRPIPAFTQGDGTPEGAVSGTLGDRYFNRTGAAGTFLYVKTTATGNTGWIAYA